MKDDDLSYTHPLLDFLSGLHPAMSWMAVNAVLFLTPCNSHSQLSLVKWSFFTFRLFRTDARKQSLKMIIFYLYTPKVLCILLTHCIRQGLWPGTNDHDVTPVF